jgi:hypothetical protein
MPVPSTDSAPLSERDVALLVDMVRLSRVTLLVAEPGSRKSRFLHSHVMPLLNARKLGSLGGEISILFDEWDKAPLPALHARIRQCVGASGVSVAPPGSGTLVEHLEAWQDAMSETFLIILDRFEDFLRAPRDASSTAEFETAFVHIANDPTLRVNFLLALEQDAEPLLAHLRRHIPRLGYSSVRLPGTRAEAESAGGGDVTEDVKPETPPTRRPPREERQPVRVTEPAPDTRPVAPETRVSTAEVRQPVVQVEDHAVEASEPPLPRMAPPKRGLSRFAWIPVLLIATGIVYVMWKPQFDGMVKRIAANDGGMTGSSKPAPSDVPPPALTTPAPAAAPARTAEASPAEKREVRKAEPVATKAPEASAKPVPTETTKAAKAPEPPKPAPGEIAKGAKAAEPSPKSAPSEAAKTAKAADPLPKLAPIEAKSRPPVRESVVATAPATAPASAATQRSAAEAVSGPVLRINVRTEAQRARAKQLVGPLKERGIHVTSIRMVPAHGEIAHIRYYRATERSEAMRVAAAVSDLGLSARQLRQMGENASTTPRQYELWLAAE